MAKAIVISATINIVIMIMRQSATMTVQRIEKNHNGDTIVIKGAESSCNDKKTCIDHSETCDSNDKTPFPQFFHLEICEGRCQTYFRNKFAQSGKAEKSPSFGVRRRWLEPYWMYHIISLLWVKTSKK